MDEEEAEEIINKNTPTVVPGRGHRVRLVAGQIIVQKVLGVGGQGSAFLVGTERNRDVYVAKILTADAQDDKDTFTGRTVHDATKATEARILIHYLTVPHERIISLLATNMYQSNAVLYYEFCNAGDLQRITTGFWKHRQHVPEGFLWHIFRQLTEAVAFIHRVRPDAAIAWGPILHCDLKPPNVFLTWPAEDYMHVRYPNIKLGDFGLATALRKGIQSKHYQNGTPPFCAPEWPRTSIKSDVWGIGAILHTVVHRGLPPIKRGAPKEPPVQGTKRKIGETRGRKKAAVPIANIVEQDPFQDISNDRMNSFQTPRYAHDAPPHLSRIFRDTLRIALIRDYNERPTSEELRNRVVPLAIERAEIMFRALPDWYEAELGDHDTVVMEDGRFNPPTWKRASQEPQDPLIPDEQTVPNANAGVPRVAGEQPKRPTRRGRSSPIDLQNENEEDESILPNENEEDISPPQGKSNEEPEDAEQSDAKVSPNSESSTNIMDLAHAAMRVVRAAGNAFPAGKASTKAITSPAQAAISPVKAARMSKKARRVPRTIEGTRKRHDNSTIIYLEQVGDEEDLWTISEA